MNFPYFLLQKVIPGSILYNFLLKSFWNLRGKTNKSAAPPCAAKTQWHSPVHEYRDVYCAWRGQELSRVLFDEFPRSLWPQLSLVSCIRSLRESLIHAWLLLFSRWSLALSLWCCYLMNSSKFWCHRQQNKYYP